MSTTTAWWSIRSRLSWAPAADRSDGTGANGDDAMALYAEHAPDIALLDIQMPGRDGLSAAREILERDPAARVVFLTTFSDDEYIVSALKLAPAAT